jgi:hypothetical protein
LTSSADARHDWVSMPIAAHGITFPEELSGHHPPQFAVEIDGEWLHVVGPDGPLAAAFGEQRFGATR